MSNPPKSIQMTRGISMHTYGILRRQDQGVGNLSYEVVRYLIDWPSPGAMAELKASYQMSVVVASSIWAHSTPPKVLFEDHLVSVFKDFMGTQMARQLIKEADPWNMQVGEFRLVGQPRQKNTGGIVQGGIVGHVNGAPVSNPGYKKKPVKTGGGQTLKPVKLKSADVAKQLANRHLRHGSPILDDDIKSWEPKEPVVCDECKGTGEYECPITAKKSPCTRGCGSQSEKY